MTMVKNKNKKTFKTRKKIKTNRVDLTQINLSIDYSKIDEKDVYGFYLANQTTCNNKYQLPDIGSFVKRFPDFLALETELGLYNKTDHTCVCWFKDDSTFDTIDGLYNAIIYKDIELLKYYKNRYKNVKYFISPDYSTYGDFDFENVIHNIKKSIIVYLWLTIECDAIVFPLMTYSNEDSLDWCFNHIMEHSNIALSLKGISRGEDKKLFLKALKKLVDCRNPQNLIVYSDCCENSTKELLSYAYEKQVNVILVNNTLLERNTIGKKNGKKDK